MANILDILAAVELPETSVTLCLKGSLVARYERLEAELAGADLSATSLADSGSSAKAGQMEALRAEMLAYEQEFLFRALPPMVFEALRETRPADLKDDAEGRAAYHRWLCQVVATCCYDPAMTADQAELLSQGLSSGQWRKLSNAAWEVNVEAVAVPFSFAASVLNRASDKKSKPRGRSGSAGRSSSVNGSVASEPPLNATPTPTSLAG